MSAFFLHCWDVWVLSTAQEIKPNCYCTKGLLISRLAVIMPAVPWPICCSLQLYSISVMWNLAFSAAHSLIHKEESWDRHSIVQFQLTAYLFCPIPKRLENLCGGLLSTHFSILSLVHLGLKDVHYIHSKCWTGVRQ